MKATRYFNSGWCNHRGEASCCCHEDNPVSHGQGNAVEQHHTDVFLETRKSSCISEWKQQRRWVCKVYILSVVKLGAGFSMVGSIGHYCTGLICPIKSISSTARSSSKQLSRHCLRCSRLEQEFASNWEQQHVLVQNNSTFKSSALSIFSRFSEQCAVKNLN